MGRQHLQFAILLGLAFCSFTPLRAKCQAQIDPTGQPLPDRPDCPPIAVLHPLPMSTVTRCQKAADVEVTMPLKPDADGQAQEKRVRGSYEFQEYVIPEQQREYAFDNLIRLLPMAGFTVQNSNKPSSITARKGDTWMLINVSDEFYNVSVVVVPEEFWKPVKTADEISKEMKAHGRVDIYGIEFSPPDQAIQEKQSDILFEILKYLKANPELSVVIESHKISAVGYPEDDSEITRERANTVIDWLVAHGVARSRLQPLPCGRDNPIADSESPAGAKRNERIAIAKAKS